MAVVSVTDLLKELKTILVAATWSDEPARKVFPVGSVRIVSNPDLLQMPVMRSPLALISPSSSVGDDEEPGLDVGTILVRLARHHHIDRMGERGLVGTKYKPRGLLDLAEQARLDIQRLHRPNVPIVAVSRGNSETVHSDNNGPMVTQDITISAPVAFE